ncbi:hypothetical protein LTR84_002048 [Exophiala bonariae]|uniref:Small ribosomal subunit protein uS7 domain-containing protein n=1 Tax=Exophiala bonariae TaxID=1690606 RepID=A0AAV9NCV6_9EURO|nr:hypothetical protein LTR84_002048 [Exophiala bonariae]
MPPRLNLFTARSVAFRTRPSVPQKPFASTLLQQRAASDNASSKQPATTPVDPDFKGPNTDQLPHVSEEQAALDKSMGNTPPDINQGTPVQEILQRDKDAQDKAPEVLKQAINSDKQSKSPSGTRSYSTSVRRLAEVAQVDFIETQAVGLPYPDAGLGHKFPLPDMTNWNKTNHFKRRYDTVLNTLTKMLMRHGKLSRAQSFASQQTMDDILTILRTAPTPQGSALATDRALLTTFPREALPLSPVEYLTAAIDSVAPLIKIKQQKGVLGGGASMPIPQPLSLKQRRRTAIKWILASAENRKESKLAERVAKELINVVEGKGGAWDRRMLVHKAGISARANTRTRKRL